MNFSHSLFQHSRHALNAYRKGGAILMHRLGSMQGTLRKQRKRKSRRLTHSEQMPHAIPSPSIKSKKTVSLPP